MSKKTYEELEKEIDDLKEDIGKLNMLLQMAAMGNQSMFDLITRFIEENENLNNPIDTGKVFENYSHPDFIMEKIKVVKEMIKCAEEKKH